MSVIIPAYEEEDRLGPTLDQLLDHHELGSEAEIIVVDDGSRDNTFAVSEERLADMPYGQTLRSPVNRGKGSAIRRGARAARGDKIIFMDADLATSLDAVGPMLARLDDADLVIGSRDLAGAVVTGQSAGRAVMHRTFSARARGLLGLEVSDPQCGFKGFRRDVAKLLFEHSRVDGFSFDLEILVLAQSMGLRIEELPVRWHAVHGSKVRPLRDPVAMAVDIARVRYRHRRWEAPLVPQLAA